MLSILVLAAILLGLLVVAWLSSGGLVAGAACRGTERGRGS
jgi:hypothetical protein